VVVEFVTCLTNVKLVIFVVVEWEISSNLKSEGKGRWEKEERLN